MLSINTNLSSLIAQNSMRTSTNKLNQTIERMTTGAKINHAKDNAANYSINTNMTTKISAYDVAADNVAMGMDMITTADETLGTISDKLSRLRALIVTAQNGTYGEKSLNAMEFEAEALIYEIQRDYSNTSYNGINLFETKRTSLKDFENLERVSEATTLERNKSYRIDDYQDLVALQDFVNNGGNTTNMTFELTADINMKDRDFRWIGISPANCFKGTFHGNNHVIRNLEINISEDNLGLFGFIMDAAVDSIAVEDCNIKGNKYIGGLFGQAIRSNIENSYITGNLEAKQGHVGGLAGYTATSNVKNCYTNIKIKNETEFAGGLIGNANSTTIVQRCFSIGSLDSKNITGGLIGGLQNNSILEKSYAITNILGKNNVGGLIGLVANNSTVDSNYCSAKIEGSSSAGSFISALINDVPSGSNNYCAEIPGLQPLFSGTFAGVETKTEEEIKAICSPEAMGFTEENGWKIVDGEMHLAWEAVANLPIINLQVGVSSSDSSNISFKMGFNLSGLNDILDFGLTNKNTLNIIDDLMSRVSEKQTEYGAITNRLESVLDEILIQHDNLVSSRSTIRDADIAEVSSQYIQQQILQQASATLLASTQNIQAQNVLGLIQSLRK